MRGSCGDMSGLIIHYTLMRCVCVYVCVLCVCVCVYVCAGVLLASEKQQLQTDVDRLRIEKTHVEGHKQGQEDHVRHFQRDLQSELYAGIEDRYRDKQIQVKVRGHDLNTRPYT